MARFIDSDKLICQVQNNDKYGTIIKQVFISLLQNSETEDVAPVIHAHWETTKLTSKWIFVCSHCHDGWYERYEDDNIIWKYCPDCGAKMDEEVDDG